MPLTRVKPPALDRTLNYAANTFTANYITFGDGTTQTTAGVAVDAYARTQANTANATAVAAFNKANTSGSGYLANSVIFANSTGYLSNTNTLQFYTSNNTLVTTSLTLTNGGAGQITFADGTVQTTAASGAATDQTARNLANTANLTAVLSFNQANTANIVAIAAYAAANTKLPLVGGTVTGNLIISTTGYIVIQNTQTSISNTSGTITISGAGGIGVGGSIYVGNRVGFSNSTSVSVAYQVYNQAVNGVDTVFG